ncbi:hypothetical protein JVU11DRAFT_9229 [Chiua virens]|nr:hypothetical protein JVU11DRAFT_9229 [Chiua virens]
MGRTKQSTKKAPQPPGSPKKARRKRLQPPESKTSLKVIERLKEAEKEAHLKAKNTKKCYTGHVKRGRDWLARHWHLSIGNNSEMDSEQQTCQQLPLDNIPESDDPYDDPCFLRAFDRMPNACSDKALALFLTYKGFHQSLSKGTVEGIRAAFKDLWDNVDGDRYRGRWRFDRINQRWEGNPADSAEVNDIMSSLKHKISSEEGDRRHSLLMSKGAMEKMLAWAKNVCPDLDAALCALRHILDSGPGVPASEAAAASGLQMDLAKRALITRHLEQLAFNTTAWVLWTRSDSLLTSQLSDCTQRLTLLTTGASSWSN